MLVCPYTCLLTNDNGQCASGCKAHWSVDALNHYSIKIILLRDENLQMTEQAVSKIIIA